jgi:hypothetical protein
VEYFFIKDLLVLVVCVITAWWCSGTKDATAALVVAAQYKGGCRHSALY